MSFPSKKGCPLCGIVSHAASERRLGSRLPGSPSPVSPSPPSSSFPVAAGATWSRPSSSRAGKGRVEDEPEIIWHDENFTVYRERAHPVSSIVHLVVIFNLHVPSLYMLSSSDVPLLIQLRDVTLRLLAQLNTTPEGRSSSSSSARPSLSSTPSASPLPTTSILPPTSVQQPEGGGQAQQSQFRVGFITPPWKDTQIPVKDHLHAHAYVAPMDLCSWWRSFAYGPLAWYAVDDLIAEIREESTNNRIRSADSDVRRYRPIDRVPGAGARSGTASGRETTQDGLASATDLEAGRASSGSEGSSGYRAYLKSPQAARLTASSYLDSDLNTPLVNAVSPTHSSFGYTVSRPGSSSSSAGPSGSLHSPMKR